MISPAELIHLPFSPDLTQAGIRYTCRMLSRASDPQEAARDAPLRQSVAQAVLELALIRHLTAQTIPFTTLADAPFTDPQHTGLVLGGHRCQVHTHLLTRAADPDGRGPRRASPLRASARRPPRRARTQSEDTSVS